MPYSNSTESECNCIMVDIMRNIQDSVCVHSIAQGAHCMLCRCVIHLAWCRLWLHNSTHCCLCLQDQHQYNVSHIRQSADFDSFVQHKWQLAKQKNKKRTRSSKSVGVWCMPNGKHMACCFFMGGKQQGKASLGRYSQKRKLQEYTTKLASMRFTGVCLSSGKFEDMCMGDVAQTYENLPGQI